MEQDFTKRLSIVVNRELPTWQVLNTVAHISAYFGNKMTEQFDTGDYFITKDSVNLPRNSQYPIIVLSTNADTLAVMASEIRNNDQVKSMFFIRQMIETTSDEEIQSSLNAMSADEVEYLGVGIFGENEIIKQLTKGLFLWK